MKEAEIRAIVQLLAQQGDVIYKVLKKPKHSKLFRLWDRLTQFVPHVMDALDERDIFLIASEHSGKFVEVQDGKVIKQTIIPNWTQAMKHEFTTLTLGGYVYKKYREL